MGAAAKPKLIAARSECRISSLHIAACCLGLFLGILWLYSPALEGHFVFDDLSLPFVGMTREGPLRGWLSVRPVLMISYWVNERLWGTGPFSYHLVNVGIHTANSALVLAILFRLLKKAGWAQPRAAWASLIGALVFAIHPLQTESVSYVAGRSESLAAFFLLLAYASFLYRPTETISWRESLIVLMLFGLGVGCKENAVSLAGILVLTDLFWPEPFSFNGIRRNWRLYALMVPGLILAAISVVRVLAAAQTAGFSVTTFKWYQYAFTEARALFTYVRLAILPIGQSLDQDYAASHTLLEHGAIFYVAALAAIVSASLIWRRRYPLLSFGLLTFLIWLAPTSSIVPLDDALVERRMYLPLLGLILIACEAASHLRLSRRSAIWILTLIALAFGKLCYDRNRLWGQPELLIELAASQAVYNPRPLLNFTEILIQQNRCDLAPAYLRRAENRLGSNYYVNAAWGRTLACLGRFDQALRRLEAAARLQPCSRVYEWMGLVYAQMGHIEQAGKVLKFAVALDPKSESAHGTLALWYEKTRNFAAAESEYRRALSLNRNDWFAQFGLLRASSLMTGSSPASSQSGQVPAR